MAPRKNITDDERIYQCPYCRKAFKDQSSFYFHKSLHTSNTVYSCDKCPYTCVVKKYLARHKSRQHGAGRRGPHCTQCNKQFHTPSALNKHMRVHTGEKPYICPECGKAFSSTYTLSVHKFIHTGEKPYHCSFCDYACRDGSTLRKHQHRHLGIVKTYPCAKCKKSFKSSQTRKLHVEEVHFGVDTRRVPCSHCKKLFKTQGRLTAHIKMVHDADRKVNCEICDRMINKHNMMNHLKTHIDVRPYKCGFVGCDKAFKDPSSLRKHTIIHYPEHQYQCDLCDSRFARKHRLNIHRKLHNTRGCSCDYCGLTFIFKKTLLIHIVKKHKNPRQYICDYCGITTHSRRDITQHIQYGHGNRQDTKCKICNKRVSHYLYLQTHYFKRHNVKYVVRETKEPKLRIKEELMDNSEFNFDYHVQKTEIDGGLDPDPEYADTETTLAYSATVLAEDMSAAPGDVPRDLFQEFFIQHVADNVKGIKALPKSKSPDKSKTALVRKSIDNLLNDRRKKTEAVELEKFRQNYNRRIQMAYMSTTNKEPTKLKFFKKPDYNESSTTKDIDLEPEKDTQNNLQTDFVCTEVNIENNNIIEDLPSNEIEELPQCEDLPSKDITSSLPAEDISIESNLPSNDMTMDGLPARDIITSGNLPAENSMIDSNLPAGDIPSNDDLPVNCITTEDLSAENIVIERRLPVNDLPEAILPQGGKTANDLPSKDILPLDEKLTKRMVTRNVTKMLNNNKKVRNEKITKSSEEINTNGKLKLNGYECYVCFKLFKTKSDLKTHCKEHYEICNEIMLKKCPIENCNYVTNRSIKKHIQLAHNYHLNGYGHVTEKNTDFGSKYVFSIDEDCELEVIPSISNLNRIACMKLDEKIRRSKSDFLGKTALVKKGNGWVVEKQKFQVSYDYILPEFSPEEYSKVCLEGENYLDRMKKIAFLAKKRGLKMLYPCDGCDKICQTMAALKLHSRKHELNPKQFKPKVWINRKIEYKTKNRKKVRCSNKTLKKMKESALAKKTVGKTVTTGNVKIIKNTFLSGNRFAPPKPVKNKHKCDKKLIDFYKNNIKGGDIEFWQFLKIFNKMGRENVNDFEDLENRQDVHFGIHLKEPEQPVITENVTVLPKKPRIRKVRKYTKWNTNKVINVRDTSESEPEIINEPEISAKRRKVDKVVNISVSPEPHLPENNATTPNIVNNSSASPITVSEPVLPKTGNKKFTRAIMISKKEYLRRNEIKKQMRMRLKENKN
ncbi:uncharacterized protein LOC142985519 [Anticarsia gemmatalis]|uniref:uncharacterized protein LOC142985519 n=1 Tax=Anticarsia gemmatalis TaxID=129554 RepID=UPI003F766FC3